MYHHLPVLHRAMLALFLLPISLPGQEFEFGIEAPEAIFQNSTFEARFTVTTRSIPPGGKGVQSWSLGVSHHGLTLLSATTGGTIVDDLFQGGFAITEAAAPSAQRPDDRGFISRVILSQGSPDVTLPPDRTVTVARATYRVDGIACATQASLAVADGLVGSGQPVVNGVTWSGRTFFPVLQTRSYPGCAPNDYRLHLTVPQNPLLTRQGERDRFTATVRLGQKEATAASFSLAVAHDPRRMQILEVSLQGTGVPELLGPDGFALFEITSGPGNAGFTARVELSPEAPSSIPAPDHPLALARYELVPLTDPSLVGTQVQTSVRFADALAGSGGAVRNGVQPEGNLLLEPLALSIEVLPPARFIRGDANGDGQVDIGDAVSVLFHLFGGGGDVCAEAANSNDDTHLDLTDIIFTLERLFVLGLPFPRPSETCGSDPTFPSLGCALPACP